jgi:lactase-phlorizin hydrolase
VKWWITINDPHSISYGYSDPQSFAPGVNGTSVGYYLAAHTLIKSHARVYRLYEKEFRNSQGGKKTHSIIKYCTGSNKDEGILGKFPP